MATITEFEDLEVWQLARQLNKDVYPLLNKLQEARNYELRSQLDRSAGSVMDNISEGFERDGNREFVQFLSISKGSLGEVRSQLYRAFDRGLMDEEELLRLRSNCKTLSNKIGRFMSYLKNSDIKGNKFKRESSGTHSN